VKTFGIEQATLDICVREAQRDRVLVTRDGMPVALVVGLEGLDQEQVNLGNSDEFWKLIAERRRQRTVTRSELERLARRDGKRQRFFTRLPGSVPRLLTLSPCC
jgi:antitoxin (DNA-binding transcriptional repressor) of toxin-antitoxin stability system